MRINLPKRGEEESRATLDELSKDWLEIVPAEDLRLLAMLVSKAYPLKAADCPQLAAALRWSEGGTSGVGFVCLDNRLRRVVEGEGFQVLPEDAQL